jgi:hypothetical protein
MFIAISDRLSALKEANNEVRHLATDAGFRGLLPDLSKCLASHAQRCTWMSQARSSARVA